MNGIGKKPDSALCRPVALTKEECYCGIEDFYKLIAAKLHIDPDNVGYNCTKILVSRPVQNQIFAYYKEQRHASDLDIAITWMGYGPKSSLPEDGYLAEVQEGFFMEVAP